MGWNWQFPCSGSAELLGPVHRLEELLGVGQERSGVGAVEGPVVPREGEVAGGVDGDGLGPVGQVDHDRAALHAVGGEDGDLGLVDDRHRHGGAVGARVRDRERATGELVRAQLLGPGPGGQVADAAGDGTEPEPVGAGDDRDEEALEVEVHGDAEVHVVRSEEHTSELQSLMRISYAVFCLKKKTKKNIYDNL